MKQLPNDGLQRMGFDQPIAISRTSLDEVRKIMSGLRNGKAVTMCNIRAGLLNTGGGLRAALVFGLD